MRVAKLFRLPGGMQRIGEQQQAVGVEPVGGEHRRGAAAHRTTTDQKPLGAQLVTRERDDARDRGDEPRHRIGPPAPVLAVRKIEPQHVDAALAQRLRGREHRAIRHVTSGAVREHEHAIGCVRTCTLQRHADVIAVDAKPPFALVVHAAEGCGSDMRSIDDMQARAAWRRLSLDRCLHAPNQDVDHVIAAG